MKKTIDLSYNDISDEQKGKYLFGISTQTVKKAIKELEEEYFQGRNIFRNSDESSDYLFRWEICDLLKLLIWLQATDVFNDKKAKKSGVSEISIEKIIKSYEFISKADSLKKHERIILEASVQTQESKEILEYIQSAYQSMSRFLLLASISYNLYPNNIFKEMVREFDVLTTNLNSNIYNNLLLQTSGGTHIKVTKHGTISSDNIIPLSLNLKKNVVDAINRIADEIYDFDKDGICRRKFTITTDNTLQERYEDITGKHLVVSDSDYTEMGDSELDANGGIDSIRQEIDTFMNDYFSEKYHLKDDATSYSDDKINRTLRTPVKDYIEGFCWMNLLCSEAIDKSQWKYRLSPKECYQATLRAKPFLLDYHFSGFKFDQYLRSLENKALHMFTTSDALIDTEKLCHLVDQVVDQYLKDVKDFKSSTQKRMDEIDVVIKNHKDAIENINNIYSQSEAILKNMLAIILKLENSCDMDTLIKRYFGKFDDGDHIAYASETK